MNNGKKYYVDQIGLMWKVGEQHYTSYSGRVDISSRKKAIVIANAIKNDMLAFFEQVRTNSLPEPKVEEIVEGGEDATQTRNEIAA